MDGHYHIELADGDTINEGRLADTIRLAAATGEAVTGYGFVCAYGCGVLHLLTDAEEAAVRDALEVVRDDA